MCVRELRKIVIDESKTVLISRGDPHVTDVDRQLAELLGPRAVCSGQVKLATVLYSSQYLRSDSFGVSPPLY